MKRLLIYLKRHPLATLFAPLFKMLEASFELFVPLVVAKMIDIGIYQKNAGYLWRMGALLVLLGIIGFGFAITAQYFAAKSAVSTGRDLRNDLFAHINTLSFKEIDTLGTSTLINRMTNDVNQVQNGINMFLRLFLRSPFVVFGAMVMAFTVDVKAAIPFVIVIPALAVVVFAILLITMPLYKNVQKQLDDVLLSTRENLLGIRVVRAFNRQESEMESFEKKSLQLFFRQIHVGKISALLNPVTYVIINLGIIAILWSGGNQVYLGRLTQGQVIALINYMSQILVELIKLANLIVLLMRAFPSVARVQQIMDMPWDERTYLPKEQTRQNADAVSYENVSFAYPDAGEMAITDIDFSVPEHGTVGIIGGTGSGKSTVLHLLNHMYDATRGKVYVYGKDVQSYDTKELTKMVGLVSQKSVLFHGSIRDNIRFGRPEVTEDMIATAIHAAQADNVIESKEHGLDEEILQDARNLSGGQRQRLAIARALAGEPKILILDDSASALDVATDAALREAIRALPWKPTTFIISQRASSVMDADQILVMDNGCIVGKGTHEVLLQENAVYQEIYYSQFPKENAEENA